MGIKQDDGFVRPAEATDAWLRARQIVSSITSGNGVAMSPGQIDELVIKLVGHVGDTLRPLPDVWRAKLT